jgi:pimeloyl-ACP methyl ester carboxylesterase
MMTIIIILSLFLIAIHLGFRAPRNKEMGNPKDLLGIDYIQLHIPINAGKRLFGWLLAVPDSHEMIIILHGWGGNAELMLPIAMPFHRAGINVLLFDTRSHGKSDQDTFSSLPRFAEDLGDVIDWIKQHHPDRTKKIALLGHSVGAGAVLLEASKREDIAAVISISAFAHPEWMMQRYLQRFYLPSGMRKLIMRYVEWVIGHRFATFAPLGTVCKIDCPILLVHGKEDTTVPVEDARAILANCPEPHLSLLEIDDASHDSVEKIEQHGEQLIRFLRINGFEV